MMERDEFLVDFTKRLQELRVSLGYETRDSFAEAIGYPALVYFSYEQRGIVRASVLRRLVKAIETSGHDPAGYRGLLSLDAARCCGRVYHRPGRWRETDGEVRS